MAIPLPTRKTQLLILTFRVGRFASDPFPGFNGNTVVMRADLGIPDDDILAGVNHDPVIVVRIGTKFAAGRIV